MKKSEKTVKEEAGTDTVKKSVSFSKTVYKWAEEMADAGGYDNFSAYIQNLIRRDRDRERELGLAENLSAEVLEAALKKKTKS